MEHFKDNSGCSGPKKSEIFWNNSRKVQYVFAGDVFADQFLTPFSNNRLPTVQRGPCLIIYHKLL